MYNPELVYDRNVDGDFHNWMDNHYPEPVIDIEFDNLMPFLNRPFGHTGAFICALEATTTPKMVKRDRNTNESNPFSDQLVKIQTTQVVGNARYENAVNNSRLRMWMENNGPIFDLPPANEDGTAPEHFNSSPRKWGQRINNTPFVAHVRKGEHETRYYFDTLCLRSISVEYRMNNSIVQRRFNNGVEELLYDGQWFNVLPSNNKPQQANHQGLTVENMVTWRDYALESLTNIHYARRNFSIVN